MKNLLSPKYPNLLSLKPRVQFVDGRAEVSDADAETLLARTALGLVLERDPAVRESAPGGVVIVGGEDDDDEEVPEVVTEPVMPAGAALTAPEVPEVPAEEVVFPKDRASVKDWVDFLAAHNIKHDEGATRAEMKALAEDHFAQTE